MATIGRGATPREYYDAGIDPSLGKSVIVTAASAVTTEYVPLMSITAQQNIAAGAGGACSVATYCTRVAVDAGGDAFTIADGVVRGQLKKVVVEATAGGAATVTFTGAASPATLAAAKDYLVLMWNGAAWVVVDRNYA